MHFDMMVQPLNHCIILSDFLVPVNKTCHDKNVKKQKKEKIIYIHQTVATVVFIQKKVKEKSLV